MAQLCSRCILPHAPPGIVIDDQGVCSICRSHELTRAVKSEPPPLESDFVQLLGKRRGKGAYDCLVMCSGGKDSTSALYYMVKRYKVRCLAFTFDHGFETGEALDNVHRAVEKLGVDFLFFRSEYMKPLFARLVQTDSPAVICHPCSLWYMGLAFDIAARYEIPFIVAGWTKGQSTRQEAMSKCGCNIHAPEFAAMAEATQTFLRTKLVDLPQYKDFPHSMEEVLKRAQKRFKTMVVSPHWFLPHDTAEYVALIQRELGWRYPKVSYPKESTNCSLNFLSVYNSMRHHGYTHYHVEASKMIREGLLSRPEALRLLEMDFDLELLNEIAGKLGHEYR
jgi:hypothetical protein